MQEYEEKKKAAIHDFQLIKSKGEVSLKPKFTSHFFRTRIKKNKLDLRGFNKIIRLDKENLTAEVEGLTTFHDLTTKTLEYGLLPRVVPELRNITIGGAISGLGVEASSFKYGLVHDSIVECDVLTGTGEVITCSKKENSDLFFTLPNSLGTLGYILKCKVKLISVTKCVHLEFLRYENAEKYFRELRELSSKGSVDFIDGIIFSIDHLVIITGKFIEKLPGDIKLNNFREDVYWKYLEDKNNTGAYLTIWDYLWRWDTDVFWGLHGSPLEFSENKIFRKIFGRYLLRSDILTKINHIYHSFTYKQKNKTLHEDVLQDPCIDISKCAEFINWHKKVIGTYPLWVCPLKNTKLDRNYTLHNFRGEYLVDIGIYRGAMRPKGTDENYYNRLLEKEILKLSGMKGLYSLSFFSEKEFWSMYDKEEYFNAKHKYDPENVFSDIFKKSVGKTTL